MQATVSQFDPESGSGQVVTDDGRTIAFPASAFARSGLRLLRPGQRVRMEFDSDGEVSLVTIVTLP